MSNVDTDIVEAFESTGMPSVQAIKAAAAFNKSSDNRMGRIESRLDKLEDKMSGVQADLKLLKWMVGMVIGGIFILILRDFFH